jgi:hypothetical protein
MMMRMAVTKLTRWEKRSCTRLYSSRMASHKISRFNDITGVTGFRKVIAMRCDDNNEARRRKQVWGCLAGCT